MADRRGLTLIEVCVVLAISLILVTLTACAVQVARAAARRAECAHNLHQWGLAYHQYHDSFGTLPQHYASMLPWLGLPTHSVGYDVSFEFTYPSVPVAVCPADILANRQHVMTSSDLGSSRGQINYPVNGTQWTFTPRGGIKGWQGGPIVRWRDVSDGLAQTAQASEKLVYVLDRTVVDRRNTLRSPWAMSPRLGNLDVGPDELRSSCANNASHPLLPDPIPTQHFGDTVGSFHYDHTLPSGHVSCVDRGSVLDDARRYLPQAATSAHEGGVNVLLCDGAVRFISNSVSQAVWWSLGTASGQDSSASE